MSEVDDAKREVAEARKQAVKELAEAAKKKLAEADAHPIGHILCEIGRAKYQRRTLSLDEMLDLAFGATRKP